MTTVLSITAHEEPLCILDQCFNNILVGEYDAVIIHINALSNIDTQTLQTLINQTGVLKGRALINPLRIALPPMQKKKSPLTAVLHRAFISNYYYAKSLFGHIDKFCLDASNSLLVRRGVQNFIARGNGVGTKNHFERWSWSKEMEHDPLVTVHGWGKLRLSQHEGSFYAGEVFDRICAFICEYEKSHALAGLSDSTIAEFPREEVLFASAYASLGLDEPLEPYVYLPWKSDLNWTPVQVIDILNGGGDLAPNYYGIKRVQRDINDPIRIAIGAHFEYRQILFDAVKSISA